MANENWTHHTYVHGRRGLWDGYADLTTTDATKTGILSFSLHPGEIASIEGKVIVKDSTVATYGSYHISATFYRTSTGDVTIVNSQVEVNSYESDSSLACVIEADTSSQEIDVSVTGLASTTLYWAVNAEVMLR